VAVGVLDGISQGAVFGDAATLPGEYTHAVVGGTASSGVLMSCLRMLTKAALPPTRSGLRKSTIIYFTVTAAISLACFFVYSAVLPRLAVVALWRKRRAAAAAGGGLDGGERRLSLEGGGGASGSGGRAHHDQADVVSRRLGLWLLVRPADPWRFLRPRLLRLISAPNPQEPLMTGEAHGSSSAEAHAGGASAPTAGPGDAAAAAAPEWRTALSSVWRLAVAITGVYGEGKRGRIIVGSSFRLWVSTVLNQNTYDTAAATPSLTTPPPSPTPSFHRPPSRHPLHLPGRPGRGPPHHRGAGRLVPAHPHGALQRLGLCRQERAAAAAAGGARLRAAPARAALLVGRARGVPAAVPGGDAAGGAVRGGGGAVRRAGGEQRGEQRAP
jgi:hypothetical protein